jgi:hypothetical protein
MEMPSIDLEWRIIRGQDGKWYAIDVNAETSDGEWHEIVPVPPHGRLIDIDAPYQIQVHVDGLTKKGGVDIYAPTVLDADWAEEDKDD